MPVCRQCGKEWPGHYTVCPDDGTRISVAPTPTVGTSSGALALAPRGDDELAPGTIAGEYVIEHKLGQGGMGAVYGARHPVIGKRAAVKVISRELSASQEAVDRFVREAQAVNQIGHPNIVDVFGFGTLADGRSFFVMEWLVGETLGERMQRPLALGEALDILEQIATALRAAHEAGVLHRDLKPDNVFLAQQKGGPSRVKLLDFGLAKLHGGGDGRIDHTRTGVVMGTPLYLSPEQAKGAKVDFPADIYSLGAIMYEMCSGTAPFQAESAVEVMAKHISERVVPLGQIAPNTPPALDALVLAMLEKDPGRRPDVATVHDELVAIRAQLGTERGASTVRSIAPGASRLATPVPSMLAAPRRGRRGLLIGLVAGAVVAAAAAVVIALGSGGSQHRRKRVAEGELAGRVPEPVQPAPVQAAPDKPAPVATEPGKPEPEKPAPVATKPEPAKPAPAKPEPVATKPEPGKPEPGRPVTVATTPHPEKPALGTVLIELEGVPRGRISIDGHVVAKGVTETELELPPGEHKVRGDAAGHQAATEEVHVTAHGKAVVKLQLKPRRSLNGVHDPFAD